MTPARYAIKTVRGKSGGNVFMMGYGNKLPLLVSFAAQKKKPGGNTGKSLYVCGPFFAWRCTARGTIVWRLGKKGQKRDTSDDKRR